MIIGVFSDIHGNLAALTRTLAALEGADALVNLGDVVGVGQVNECMDLLDSRQVLSVAGGHDLEALLPAEDDGVAFLDEAGNEIRSDFGLREEHLERIRELPIVRRMEHEGELYCFAHGLVTNPRHPEIMQAVDERNALEFLSRCSSGNSRRPAAAFVGHSHITRMIVVDQIAGIRRESVNSSARVELRPGRTVIFDVGTVATGSYVVLDTGQKTVLLERQRSR